MEKKEKEEKEEEDGGDMNVIWAYFGGRCLLCLSDM